MLPFTVIVEVGKVSNQFIFDFRVVIWRSEGTGDIFRKLKRKRVGKFSCLQFFIGIPA